MRTLVAFGVALVVSVLAPAARAEPWFGWGENALEERYIDDDLDAEDILALGTPRGRSHGGGGGGLRAGSWLTLGGFVAERIGGKREYGGMVILAFAFDRAARRPFPQLQSTEMEAGALQLEAIAQPPDPVPPPRAPAPASSGPSRLVTLSIARRAVAAAWKTAGLGADDAIIDSMIARAKTSALLPEARVRAMRLVVDKSQVNAVPDTTGTYDALGTNLWLELRLTWRFERLLYADDEPNLERMRLERHDARARVAARVLEALFLWQRAELRAGASVAGSQEATDALLQIVEAEATLEVLTGGWFGAWRKSVAEAAAGAPP
jgi:hypothetical protein